RPAAEDNPGGGASGSACRISSLQQSFYRVAKASQIEGGGKVSTRNFENERVRVRDDIIRAPLQVVVVPHDDVAGDRIGRISENHRIVGNSVTNDLDSTSPRYH